MNATTATDTEATREAAANARSKASCWSSRMAAVRVVAARVSSTAISASRGPSVRRSSSSQEQIVTWRDDSVSSTSRTASRPP